MIKKKQHEYVITILTQIKTKTFIILKERIKDEKYNAQKN